MSVYLCKLRIGPRCSLTGATLTSLRVFKVTVLCCFVRLAAKALKQSDLFSACEQKMHTSVGQKREKKDQLYLHLCRRPSFICVISADV